MFEFESISVVAALVGVVGVGVVGTLGFSRPSVPRSEGLRVVKDDMNADVDIVCVHGLGGNSATTWTTQKNGKTVNWITDLLPDRLRNPDGTRKRIRVLTYGYSTELFVPPQIGKSANVAKFSARVLRYLPQALFLHATRMIEQLAAHRFKGCKDRPIIFIAHSLGGLIVKTALVHASAAIDERDSQLKAIELLTVGVLFFGTPQQESPSRPWYQVFGTMYSLAKVIPSNMSIELVKDQAELFNLQTERYKSIESNFYNFSFYEKNKLKEKVVDVSVAGPTITKNRSWVKLPLRRAHGDLAKFDSQDDQHFVIVVEWVNKCLEEKHCQKARERKAFFFAQKDSPDGPNKQPIIAQIEDDERETLEPMISPSTSWALGVEAETTPGSLERCLKESEDVEGLGAVETLKIVREMAKYALDTQNYAKAEALYKRLFVSIQAYAPCSEELANVLREMAEVASRQGRLYEATKTLSRVRQIQVILGLEQSDLRNLQISERIANLYVTRGLYDSGCQEYDSIIEIFKKTKSVNISGDNREDSKEILDKLKKIDNMKRSSRMGSKSTREKFDLVRTQARLVEKLLREPPGETDQSVSDNDAYLKPISTTVCPTVSLAASLRKIAD